MILRAPNIALFVIAGCLAMVGLLSALPIELPIPGLSQANAAWDVFLGGSCWRPERSAGTSGRAFRTVIVITPFQMRI